MSDDLLECLAEAWVALARLLARRGYPALALEAQEVAAALTEAVADLHHRT